jgi:hypothetical protein
LGGGSVAVLARHLAESEARAGKQSEQERLHDLRYRVSGLCDGLCVMGFVGTTVRLMRVEEESVFCHKVNGL